MFTRIINGLLTLYDWWSDRHLRRIRRRVRSGVYSPSREKALWLKHGGRPEDWDDLIDSTL